MYVDARNIGVIDRRTESELVRAIHTELEAFEERLQRVQLRVQRVGPESHCQLLAWLERGQTLSIEKRAGSPIEAALLAVGSLKRALLAPWSSTRVPMKPSTRGGVPPVPGSSSGAAAPGVLPEASSRAGRVLLALHDLDAGAPNVHWAQVLAGALQAPLDVCRVVDGVSAASSSGPEWLAATRQLLTESRSARAWCHQVCPQAELVDRAVPGGQGYVEKLASIARQRRATWLVVPAGQGPRGSLAVALALRACCPVLVARAPMSRCTLLVAAEPEGANHAVLRNAARLAEAFHAPVLAFYNLGSAPPDSFVPPSRALTAPWRELQREASREQSEYRLPELDVLLAHGRDRVQAVLGQARREDADMIVVGVSSEGPADGFAASVVEQALRSVLVVPLASPVSAERGSERASTAPVRSASLADEVGLAPAGSGAAAE